MTASLVAAVTTTLVLWASGFVAIRVAVAEYPPGALALVRFGVASVTIAVLALLLPSQRVRLPAARDLPGFLATGIAGIAIYHLALNAGERTVSAGGASLIVNLNPIFTALIAAVVLGERLGSRGWVGVLVGFVGALLVSLGEGGEFRIEPGAGLVLVAAISQAVYFVMQKPYLARYTPLEATAYAVWLGTLCLAPFAGQALAALHASSTGATVAAVYLGIFPGAVAYTTWAVVLARLPAGRATSLLYLVPPIALVLAWVGLGERPSAMSLVGGAVALGGVALVNARRSMPAAASVPARPPA
ncbi:MAG: DMT family transporter [Gemmatimonadales bacterium]